MNGSSQPSPELPLPVTSPEGQGNAPETTNGGMEKVAPGAEAIGQQGPASPMPMVDPSQFAAPTVAPQATSDPAAIYQANADDADVIEKEWVTKAKDIVERTRSNPREQSAEISNFKAVYIKKRFNKDLKQPKEA